MGGATTRYTLDVTGGLPERLGTTTGGMSTWYVRGWGGELSRESGGTANTWYLGDRLGTVRGVVDGSGALMSGYNYDPYGTPDGASSLGDFGFTGEPQNAATNPVHLRARWYSTSSGSFTTHDPLSGFSEQPMSRHYYMYGYNNPITNTDPTGEQTVGGDQTLKEQLKKACDAYKPFCALFLAYSASELATQAAAFVDWNAVGRGAGVCLTAIGSVMGDFAGVLDYTEPVTDVPLDVDVQPKPISTVETARPGATPVPTPETKPRPQSTRMVPPLPPNSRNQCDPIKCQAWKMSLPQRIDSRNTGTAWHRYQVGVTGSAIEYDVTPSDLRPTWADGIDCSTCSIVEAKLTEGGQNTSAWQGGRSDNAVGARAHVEKQLLRYKAVIDSEAPVVRVQYYTQDPRSIPYFTNILASNGVPGSCNQRVIP
ncbi:MAG TPA: RHS repeat-associated core domain-containing protein [Chloroflexia bacterium]|nr:RHS repeat-associated core domain-containing protein [Chloroflexia bacterium]